MPVVLKFQSTGSIPGKGEPVKMNGPSLTIGRGNENDLVLPDPDRMLSKRHCAIEDHNGNVMVVDFSTNGTFLNYGKLALGTTPTPLNDGDILSLGPYELLVNIISEAPADRIADPIEDGPVSHGRAGGAPTLDELLDAPGDGGDFLDELLGGRDGPVGPAGVQRDEPDDDGLLPPLGEEEGILPPAEDPWAGQGASSGSHAPSSQDYMSAPRASQGGPAIPDDWDEDLLGGKPSPRANSGDPFATPEPSAPASGGETVAGGASAFIPDDFDEDFLTGGAPNKAARNPEPSGPQPESPVPPVSTPSNTPQATEVPEPAIEPASAPESKPEPDQEEAPAPKPQAASVPEKQSASGADDAASRAFLRALGAADIKLESGDLETTMSRLGHVLRVMIEGMREILMTRTSIKSEFRIEQTMIKAGGNNPLKFSITPEQAIEAMVKPSAKGYLDATDAADQALKDIKAHEVAMVTGMQAAIRGILKRLDPRELEEKISVGGGFSSVLKSKKARYWEIYEDMYAEISDQAENDFHELFAKEFARAYQEQLDKLK